MLVRTFYTIFQVKLWIETRLLRGASSMRNGTEEEEVQFGFHQTIIYLTAGRFVLRVRNSRPNGEIESDIRSLEQ